MTNPTRRRAVLAAGWTAASLGFGPAAALECRSIPEAPRVSDAALRAIAPDPALEARIESLLAGMTLRQKVGQMTQAEIQSITPDEVRRHHIGSVLSGGGSWPRQRRDAAPADWLALADAYWEASMSTDAKVKIPLLWGIDAVHGHGNVRGATLFPHNIGLGAARDRCLVRRIGQATAQQMRVTGQDWNFAPAVSVVRDDRWGRSYEGYAEQPSLPWAYAGEYVAGVQGGVARPAILATAKHFIGDGGTVRGVDQGVTPAGRDALLDLHGPGYVAAIAAGVRSVMVSFNSVADTASGAPEKLHGSRAWVTGVLKERLGFDGLVVSDWDGHAQVPGCDSGRCARAVQAGIDVFMVPQKWRQFIDSTVAQVDKGELPLARIDDAVRRILRAKLRAGLFEAPKPSLREGAGRAERLLHRELAREAVRQSLVLLKNDGGVLPLARTARVLVVGRGADNLPMQAGGWSVTWQGTETGNADFPQGTSVLAGIRQALGEARVAYDASARGVDLKGFDAVIAVIGEAPYAEMKGDLQGSTLSHAQRYDMDLRLLQRVSGQGVPVVTVLLSGRPLYVNRELNRSDAFVAAWLPGTEGQGIADLLFRRSDGAVDHDFTGRLSFSWPASACQTPLNVGDAAYRPLFAYGYGLSYAAAGEALGRLPEPPEPASCD